MSPSAPIEVKGTYALLEVALSHIKDMGYQVDFCVVPEDKVINWEDCTVIDVCGDKTVTMLVNAILSCFEEYKTKSLSLSYKVFDPPVKKWKRAWALQILRLRAPAEIWKR